MPGDVQVEPISRAVTAHRTARWHRLVPAIVTDEWIMPMEVGNLRIGCPFRKVFHHPSVPWASPQESDPKVTVECGSIRPGGLTPPSQQSFCAAPVTPINGRSP